MDDEYNDETYNPEEKKEELLPDIAQDKLRPKPPTTYTERPSSLSSDEYNDRVHLYRNAATQTYKRRKIDSGSSSVKVVKTPEATDPLSSGSEARNTQSPMDELTQTALQSGDISNEDSPSNVAISPTLYSVPEETTDHIQSPAEAQISPPAPLELETNSSSGKQEGTEFETLSALLPNTKSPPVNRTDPVSPGTQYTDVSSSDTSIEEKDLGAEKLKKIYLMKATRRAQKVDEDLELKLKIIDLELKSKIIDLELKSKIIEMQARHEARHRKRKIWEAYRIKCIIKDLNPGNFEQ